VWLQLDRRDRNIIDTRTFALVEMQDRYPPIPTYPKLNPRSISSTRQYYQYVWLVASQSGADLSRDGSGISIRLFFKLWLGGDRSAAAVGRAVSASLAVTV
jgi:hypothetical protein